MNGSKFNSGSGGVVTSMSVHVGAVDNSPNNQYQVAIYSDNNNTPGTLITKSSTGSLIANSWNTISLPSTSLSPNTNYWLMYNSNGTSSGVNDMTFTSGGIDGFSQSAQTFGSWPTTFPTATVESNFSFNIYTAYLSSTPSPSPTASPTPTPTQSPSNSPSPSSTPLPGDLNGDGHVNLTDLSIMATNYGLSGSAILNPAADINHDGVVNLTDLSLLATNYGR